MNRILCVAVVLSGALLSWPASAGMSEGVAAVTVGDYAKAIAEFQPLAAGGDPAAQYQLAKIYLEGHGPADGVPQGIDLMTKAANGNYPEAQAQLGLMYAMGLGVPVDNAKAYQWLNKAVGALPEGTRRTVAEANRDTVLKRMSADQKATAAAAPAATDATTTQAAAQPESQPAITKSTASDSAMGKATTPVAATTAKTPAPETTPPKVTETANVPTKPAKETATGGAAAAKAPDTFTQVASAKAPEPAKDSTAAATSGATAAKTSTAPAASTTTTAKAPDTSTQVASAKADATSAPAASAPASQAAPSGVRIQLISMASETAAWDAWKQLSGKYSAQLSGLTPTVEPADLGDKGTFYRVQAGPFASVTAAQDRCSAMKQAGLDCLVVGKP